MQETLNRLGRGPGSRKASVNDVWSLALLASGRLAEARRAMGTAWRAADEAKALEVRHRLALIQSWLEMRRTGRPDPLSKEQIAPADKSFIYIPGVATYSVEARAAEPLGMWPEAAAEYEEVLKSPHRKEYLSNPAVWILDRFRAAQAYERLGEAARARQWYERFAADWKEADPDVPELIRPASDLQR